MKFQQRRAGNAKRRSSTHPGASARLICHTMSHRIPLLTTLLLIALPAGAAHAGDPLLSGYAGPGSGEQVILGGATVGGKGGGGSGGTGGAAATARQSLRAPAAG